ncbi:MAG: cobalt-precorrin-5B (C(1))-methyltransferase CbiD, partial [Xanthobacteraceae bacterium]
AAKTLNGRLGIVGGLSILGTTGIVVPYSCSAWIHSIHSGIEVARAAGLTHIAGATGASSEAAVQMLYGLPVPPGEPAINPVPRRMIRDAIAEIADAAGRPADADVEISIPGGEALAAKTLNGRLGIVGGLSILGTTGIVVPYSCSAWIHSIYSGIEVARAAGLTHIAGATGASSEAAVQKLYGLPEIALIDMGDFVGGMLKYLRRHPVARVTIAGGVAKMTKLAQGLTDLHSKRGEVDLAELANFAAASGGDAQLCQRILSANTAAEAFTLAQDAGIALGDAVALAAQHTAEDVIAGRDIAVEVALFDREQNLVGRAPFKD